jgi:hypothetical protein
MGEVDRKQLEDFLKKEITKLFESVLDYTSIAVPDSNTFKLLRGRILRIGNDCIRTVISELNDYNVSCLDINEDIIEINKGK